MAKWNPEKCYLFVAAELLETVVGQEAGPAVVADVAAEAVVEEEVVAVVAADAVGLDVVGDDALGTSKISNDKINY